ncbi:hypothetical protein KIPB_009782, partial [Kipferlia bialata]|eukprot:g9782.t1
MVHPGSALFKMTPLPRAVLYAELFRTKATYLVGVSAANPAMLALTANNCRLMFQ